MRKREIKIAVTGFSSLDELPEEDRSLLQAARGAAGNAYAPYSGFRVGAALRLADGRTVSGNNQENASSPVGCCAERTALFWANANYPDVAVEAVAVSALGRDGVRPAHISPCGMCRQALLETEIRFSHPIRILLDNSGEIDMLDNAKSLLPLSFDSGALNSL
ncbi:MAG: cytidine deaminase [Mangrovibacterium sp.]